jgi:hypothetical protein
MENKKPISTHGVAHLQLIQTKKNLSAFMKNLTSSIHKWHPKRLEIKIFIKNIYIFGFIIIQLHFPLFSLF